MQISKTNITASFSSAENKLRSGEIAYINKPFPKDNYAQLIKKDGQVDSLMSRIDYNDLKRVGGMEERKLPPEEGLKDWIGLFFVQPK